MGSGGSRLLWSPGKLVTMCRKAQRRLSVVYSIRYIASLLSAFALISLSAKTGLSVTIALAKIPRRILESSRTVY